MTTRVKTPIVNASVIFLDMELGKGVERVRVAQLPQRFLRIVDRLHPLN